jgi:hypothetical protein
VESVDPMESCTKERRVSGMKRICPVRSVQQLGEEFCSPALPLK